MSELPIRLFESGREWSVADLANLPPEAPEHLELIDGGLEVRSPQRLWHLRAVDALLADLGAHAPGDLDVMREMTVVCAPRQAPEPDVCVVRGGDDLDVTMLDAGDVLLAVEVISPDSVTRDRERKPRIYAAAGIPNYWIVDREVHATVIQVYELDPMQREYRLAAVFRDRVEAVSPFPVTVDLSAARLARPRLWISGRRGE